MRIEVSLVPRQEVGHFLQVEKRPWTQEILPVLGGKVEKQESPPENPLSIFS